MHRFGWLPLVVFYNSVILAAIPPERGHDKIREMQQSDNIEGYLYACLDSFLLQPSPQRMHLLEAAEESLWRAPRSTGEKLSYVVLKSNEGYYLAQYNKIAKAVSAYESAWKVYHENGLGGYDIIEYCLKPLGNAYSMLGDFESAERIVKEYLMGARETGNHEQEAAAVVNLSIIYNSTGKFDKAVALLEEGLEARDLPEEKKGLFYINLAKNHLSNENYNNALAMGRKAMDYLYRYPSPDKALHLANAHGLLSVIYRKSGSFTRGLGHIKQAIAIADTSGIQARVKGKLHLQLADILAEKGQTSGAVGIYKRVLQQLIHEYKNDDSLPGKEFLYAENTLKEAFDGLAALYTKMDSLHLAVDCYLLSFEVENLLRVEYNSRSARYMQQQENRARAEDAILILLRLYEKEEKEYYLIKAFEIAENTKSLVSKSALHERNFWLHLGIDSLTQLQRSLTWQKAQVQNALDRELVQGSTADLGRIRELTDRQNQLMLDINNLYKMVSGDSQIFALPARVSTDSLQQRLSGRKETMIQYFLGSNHLFAFVLDGKTIRISKYDDVLKIKDEIKQLLSFFNNASEIQNNFSGFAQIAHSLYLSILPQPLDSSLVIVPDGLLNFVPFEVLLYALPGNANFAKWPWLLNKYLISYQTSASGLYKYGHRKEPERHAVLGLFPEFKNTPKYLKYSKVESEEISRYLAGKYLHDKKATKQAFLNNAPEYPILHLSTHADAGNLLTPPSISFVDSVLFLTEIYGLNINSKLMVLSACETGIGKLYRGEGTLSLADGFLQAGIKNIVFSLWKVNDYSTSKLMADFYRHYAEGKEIVPALRNAKTDYLKNENIPAHSKSPYFWASFVYYGDTQLTAPEPVHKPLLFVVALSGGLLVAAVYLIVKKMNRAKHL